MSNLTPDAVARPPFTPSKALVLDLVERAAVLALYAFFVHRMLPRLTQLVAVQVAYPQLLVEAATINAQALLLVVSETLGVALILLRRRSPSLSSHPFDWSLCLAAVVLPLLVVPAAGCRRNLGTGFGGADAGRPGHSNLGEGGAVAQLRHSAGQSWGQAGRPYRFLRHPMYAGYLLTHVGFVIGFPLLQNAVLYALAFAIQLARLAREEALLRGDERYRATPQRCATACCPDCFSRRARRARAQSPRRRPAQPGHNAARRARTAGARRSFPGRRRGWAAGPDAAVDF